MLLERIDIDSCGSLERIQLGPFSHRLNAVFGPPGSGKTATIEFVRSVMLGTDRLWHQGCAGRVVWAGRDGLLHCRREADGTSHGRLSMDFVDRNGFSQNYLHGYRDADSYNRMRSWLDLPRQAIDALVAPSRETSLERMVEACRTLGLTESEHVRDEAEIQRVREQLSQVNQRLADLTRNPLKYTTYDYSVVLSGDPTQGLTAHGVQELRTRLQERRRILVDELARLDRYDNRQDDQASLENRRSRLEVRLADARDEVARLRNQESDLRRSLSEVERELNDCTRCLSSNESSLRISSAWRLQLEELDNQLMRLGRTLREIRSIRDNWVAGESINAVLPDSSGMRYYATEPLSNANSYYRARLEAARRHLDWLMRHHDSRYELTAADLVRSAETLKNYPYEFSYIGRADLESMSSTIRELIDSLGRLDYKVTATQIHEQHLRQCEATLADSIRRLVDQRHKLLERIAGEHNVSLKHLSDAFGDWHHCQDQPHLYQWLLSEHFPPRVEDSVVRSARRNRLEAERTELMDELSRTVNRLDDSVREVRSLELRLRDLPVELPVVTDHHRRNAIREELASIETRLSTLESQYRLEEERQTLSRRLDDLLAGSSRPSNLRRRAIYWLDQMTAGRLNHLLAPGNFRTLENFAAEEHANDPFRYDRAASQTERNLVSLALRMAAAELLNRRGTQLPLLLDDPPAGWFGTIDTTPLTSAWSRFVDGGNQLIAFTAHRGLAENIRSQGGLVQSLVPTRYYHMRYRDNWDERQASLGHINRELDTVWREANGFYDDPHWYSPNQYQQTSRRAPHVESTYYDWADDYAPKPKYNGEFEIESNSRGVRGPASPFFLTEDSPVDQAPSIDAVAAQRLRMVGITVVGQLLAADAGRLAQRLDLADVSPAVVARWQKEANLVCGVPQLRNFDARVLVGCGFTSPSQLARMHPGRLLEKVEAFLATDRGRQILRSGSSYELSRITSWIAAANRSVARDSRHSGSADRELRRQRRSAARSRDAYVAHERDAVPPVYTSTPRSNENERRSADSNRRSRRERRAREARADRQPREARSARREYSGSSSNFAGRPQNGQAMVSQNVSSETVLRFYLHRESPIVDAPSIGPKTATKLQAMGIRTVDQFLNMDASQIAARLGNRRITTERIVAWQRQATLVCRIPMLRGHDAQLLVEAGIYEPERLSECEPAWLLSKIDPIAKSSEGKRILRGAKRPDLQEVTDWINWSKEHRTLRAA